MDAINSKEMAALAVKFAPVLKQMNAALGTSITFDFDSLTGMLVSKHPPCCRPSSPHERSNPVPQLTVTVFSTCIHPPMRE